MSAHGKCEDTACDFDRHLAQRLKPKEKASPDNSIDSHALGEIQHDRAAPYQRQAMRVRHSARCRPFCLVCHLFHSRLTEFTYSRGARA